MEYYLYLPKTTVLEIANEMFISLADLNEVSKAAQEPVSLSTPVGEEEDTQLEEFVEDNGKNVENEAIHNATVREAIMKALDNAHLTEREKEILFLRSGYYDNTPRTLDQVGKMYGVTRERIRQIEAKAKKKVYVLEKQGSKRGTGLIEFSESGQFKRSPRL